MQEKLRIRKIKQLKVHKELRRSKSAYQEQAEADLTVEEIEILSPLLIQPLTLQEEFAILAESLNNGLSIDQERILMTFLRLAAQNNGQVMTEQLSRNQNLPLLKYLLSSFQSPSQDLFVLFVNLTYSGNRNGFNHKLITDWCIEKALIQLAGVGPMKSRELACWVLINLIQDQERRKERFRILNETTFLYSLIKLMQDASQVKNKGRSLQIVNTAIRGLQVLTRPFDNVQVDYEQFMEYIVQSIAEYFFEEHTEIFTYSVKILKDFSGLNPGAISPLVSKLGLLPILVNVGLQFSRRQSFLPTFQAIGNLLVGEHLPLFRELLFSLNFVDIFNDLMKKFQKYKDSELLGEGLWLLTNLPIYEKDVFNEICSLFHWTLQYLNSSVSRLRVQSIVAIQNFLYYCDDHHTFEFVKDGLMEGLRSALKYKDVQFLVLVLSCLDELLTRGIKLQVKGEMEQNEYWEEFKKLGGEALLQNFTLHSEDKVFKTSQRILKSHCEKYKEEEERIEL